MSEDDLENKKTLLDVFDYYRWIDACREQEEKDFEDQYWKELLRD